MVWSTATIGQGRPGLFMNFVPEAVATIAPGNRGTVSVPVIAPWGPSNELKDLVRYSDIVNYYTKSETAPYNAHFTLSQLFLGGALKIKAYRLVGANAARAEMFIQDTAATPVNAIRMRGKYDGVLGNTFKVVVQANAADTTKTDVILYEGTTKKHTWTNSVTNRGVAGHMQDIVNTINQDVNNFSITAELVGADGGGTASTPTSIAEPGTSLTGGSDGDALTSSTYLAALAAFETHTFEVFYANVLDADIGGITASIKQWVKDLRDAGKMVTWVTGSALGETATQAETNAKALNAPYVEYVWPGVKMTNVDGVLTTYRGVAFAAQVAGARASLTPGYGLTHRALINVVDLETRPNDTVLEGLLANGVMPLSHDGEQFIIEKGQTTLVNVSTSNPGTTLSARLKKSAVVNTVDAISNSIKATGNKTYVGKVINDTDGLKALEGAIREYLRFMAGQRAIANDFTVSVSEDHESEEDRVFVNLAIRPRDTMDYIYLTVTIG